MTLPNAQPRPRPAIFDKRDVLRERETIARANLAAVYERDGYACRCCGRPKGRGIALHLHHVVFRSKGGGDTTANTCVLCAFCHALIHARQLYILGKDADKRLTFEIDERAVIDVFGSREVPRDVRMVRVEGRR